MQVSLCEEHRKQRWLAILISWLMVLAGFASFFLAASRENGLWALGGVGLLVAGITLGMLKGTLLRAELIDEQVVHLRGFCPAFLEGLPIWPR